MMSLAESTSDPLRYACFRLVVVQPSDASFLDLCGGISSTNNSHISSLEDLVHLQIEEDYKM